MAEYKTGQIRNIAIIGHNGTGKSTLFDAVLFVSGKIDKMGSVAAGTLSSDFDEDEKKKKISIRSAMGFAESDGVKINILDTPGTADFVGESRAALQAAECALVVIDSVDGVQIETEKFWRYLHDNNIPRILFINKMDKERANYAKVIENVKQSLKVEPVLLTMPYGEGADLKGVVDIVNMKLVTAKDGGKNSDFAEIPAELKEMAQKERSKLVELAAEGEDELIEKFLEGHELTDEEISRSLKKQIENAKLTTVICGASEKCIGVKSLIQMIVDFAPSPKIDKEYEGRDGKNLVSKADGPAVAVVWKTYIDQYAGRFNYLKVISGELVPDKDLQNVNKKSKERIGKLYVMTGSKQNEVPRLCAGDIGVVVKLEKTSTCDLLTDSGNDMELSVINLPNPVFSFAVDPANKGDIDKIGQFFNRVTDENPTITYEYNGETKETVLSGMGELQLGIVLENLKEKAKLEVKTREPRIAYRETITKKVESQYRHKKQSGGHGQFGEVFIRIEPRKRGEGFQFSESIFGGSVPKQYIPGVEKGIIEALQEGVLGKFPVVDVAVDLFDGKYHDVDSSEMAFKIAARQAFKQGMEQAVPQLLEPIMKVSIYVDKGMMGDILSDITSRRGRVLGSGVDESGGSVSIVRATVPLSEMIRYSIDLRSMTQGKASFEMSFSHYDPISGREADNILAARKKQLEEEAAS